MTQNPMRTTFGLRTGVPENVDAVWGARLIWPDDLVHDRQDCAGEQDAKNTLLAWLSGGAGDTARDTARKLAQSCELSRGDDRQVTLYEDDFGVVAGNPQGSHGYLYVSAWAKPSTTEVEVATS